MRELLIILGVVVIALFVVWLQYNRRLKMITEVYEQVAERTGGQVVTGGLSLHPTIQLTHGGYPLVISYAYTGLPGNNTGYYTYAKFRKLPKTDLRFRLLPGVHLEGFEPEFPRRHASTGHPGLDERFTLTANDPGKAVALFNPQAVEVLLSLSEADSPLRLAILYNDDDRFLLAVSDIPTQPEFYLELVEKAGVLLEGYLETVKTN